jgi:hypothetical protein
MYNKPRPNLNGSMKRDWHVDEHGLQQVPNPNLSDTDGR